MSIALYIKVVLAMFAFVPFKALPQFPGHEESERESMARFGALAEAITLTCQDAKAPWACASLLLALGQGESGWSKDADTGPCHREGKWRTRCDSGHSASAWQVKAFGRDDAGELITIERLFADRRLAASRMLRAARGSLSMCRHLPEEDRLANLSGGGCKPGKSQRERYLLWKRIEAWRVVP